VLQELLEGLREVLVRFLTLLDDSLCEVLLGMVEMRLKLV
jgi:hypothetical protein